MDSPSSPSGPAPSTSSRPATASGSKSTLPGSCPTRARTCSPARSRSYRHLRRHTYQLHPATVADPALLHQAVGSHLAHFAASWFLAKSPFNTFRIHQLARLFGPACRFIHLHRGYQAIASIAANRFAYHHPGQPSTPTDAWVAHVQAALEQVDAAPMLHVAYERLAADPAAVLMRIAGWLGVAPPTAAPQRRTPPPSRPPGPRARVVEDLHARLAALE